MTSDDRSDPAIRDSLDLDAVAVHGKRAHFAAGEVLRQQGQHYTDMYVIEDGFVDVNIKLGATGERSHRLGPGTPIGEIGFLKGCAATATVTAESETSAVIIDDGMLWRLENEAPALAVQLSHFLAEVSDARLASDATIALDEKDLLRGKSIEVHLCRTEEMLRDAARLRYEVYCRELGRTSPFADHDSGTIQDNLDSFGHTFVALDAGELLGTMRANFPSEGSLGVLDELYGMTQSPLHPDATGICTKFIVKQSRRKGPAAIKLISAVTRYGLRLDIQECYIDCVPELMPSYKALGFKVAGKTFFHQENGPSIPMVLDLTGPGKKLTRDPLASRRQ